VEAAARGVASSLDDYSAYMDAEEGRAMDQVFEDEYEGIGAHVGMRDGHFTIVAPIYEGPAYRAGMRSLDRVVEVDGEPTRELGFLGTVGRLKGPSGTPVRMRILRRGWSDAQEITVVREKVKVPVVLADVLPGRLGYLRLARFGEGAARDVREGFGALARSGARAFILDLRDNGGGLLEAAIEVSDAFLGEGLEVVSTRGRPRSGDVRRFYATGGDVLEGAPLVVLVNGGTASASEIVSGALRDHGRARIVGERTFGKGSVQTVMPLRAADGASRLKLTVARYYLPSNTCIDKGAGGEGGIAPDVLQSDAPLSGWETEEMARASLFEKVEECVLKAIGKYPVKMETLGDMDGGSLDAYPGLREVFAAEGAKVSERGVRLMARASLRRRLADRRGRPFVTDLQDDRVLRRGVFELLTAPGLESADVPDPALAGVLDEFRGEAARERARAGGPPVRYAPPPN
jgi:C-terminal peptidase prc